MSDEHRDAFVKKLMSDKRTTLDAAVGQLESGMTIGIGGWGSRRKPMAFVRALLRTDVTDLTVVTYGGPDLGLLCSAGKVRRVYYGFVSLDSPPFYDPWFAKARTSGAIEAREMDEGMLRCGLQAAAQRLPFLPIRAGLGSSSAGLLGGRVEDGHLAVSRREGGHETLIAMPALRLDAAFVHLNLGDAQGNAAYTGIDPYFDDLFLMAAERRYLSVERVVSTDELVKAVPPQALLVNRMMVDSVVEAPGGAHFTTAAPDYGRDEKFQRHYAEAAGSDEGWQQFVATYLSGSEADYQAAVRKFAAGGVLVISVSRAEVCVVACAELFRDAGEIMISPMTTVASIGARLARLTFSPDILLTDGEAQLLADTPAIGATGAIEGWMPFGRVFETLAWGRRHVVMGANQIDRYGNQNLSAFGPLQHPTRQMFGVRGAPGNTRQPRHQLLGRQPLAAGVLRDRRRGIRHRLRQGRSRQSGLPVRQRAPRGFQPRRVRLQRPRPSDARRVAAPRRLRRRGRRERRRSRCTVSTRPRRRGWPPPTS